MSVIIRRFERSIRWFFKFFSVGSVEARVKGFSFAHLPALDPPPSSKLRECIDAKGGKSRKPLLGQGMTASCKLQESACDL